MKRLGIILGTLLLATGLVLAFEEMIWFEVWEVDPYQGTVTQTDFGLAASCADGCASLNCCVDRWGACHGFCLGLSGQEASLCDNTCLSAQTHCNRIVGDGGCAIVTPCL